LIGRRGETLDAIQYLASLVHNRGSDEYTRVVIDTANYRQKREEILVKLAHRIAAKVQKYRKSVTLEPMNPYERRIIHSTLQDVTDVKTYSIGEEPNRKVVIACK
jgi:spoIIIJ-associated protein